MKFIIYLIQPLPLKESNYFISDKKILRKNTFFLKPNNGLKVLLSIIHNDLKYF